MNYLIPLIETSPRQPRTGRGAATCFEALSANKQTPPNSIGPRHGRPSRLANTLQNGSKLWIHLVSDNSQPTRKDSATRTDPLAHVDITANILEAVLRRDQAFASFVMA